MTGSLVYDLLTACNNCSSYFLICLGVALVSREKKERRSSGGKLARFQTSKHQYPNQHCIWRKSIGPFVYEDFSTCNRLSFFRTYLEITIFSRENRDRRRKRLARIQTSKLQDPNKHLQLNRLKRKLIGPFVYENSSTCNRLLFFLTCLHMGALPRENSYQRETIGSRSLTHHVFGISRCKQLS